MPRLKTIAGESLRSLGANMSTTLAATVTVLIGMFLLGLFIALWSWAHSYDGQLKNQLAVRVYFCTPSTCSKDATKQQETAVAAHFNGDARIKQIVPVSKQRALQIMREKQPEAVKVLPANPFPDSLKIYPRSGDQTPVIGKEIQDAKFAGVQKVDWGGKLTHRVLHVTRVVESFFIAAAILLILASTLLIANTIRLSIFSRRREIEVMKLVGATNWFVRGPFMLEGLLCGLAGAVGAIVLLIVGKELVLPTLLHGPLNAGSDVKALAFSLNALVLVAVGLALGAAGSGLTIRRFLQV